MITARKAFGAGLWVMEHLVEYGPTTASEMQIRTGRSAQGALAKDFLALVAVGWVDEELESCMGGRHGLRRRYSVTQKGIEAMQHIQALADMGVYAG